MSDKPKIDARDNAMLIARNIPRLTNSDGEELDTRPAMGLCRCGASANKPLCDGSHTKVDFKDP